MILKIPEYKRILSLKEALPAERGLVKTIDGFKETQLRSTEVRWIKREEHPWVFQLMQEKAHEAQKALGITQPLFIRENIQLSTYYPGDYYGWHVDGRVMSASVLLSSNFTGGRLEMGEPGWPLLREAGQALFFPNIAHRVKPVRTGVRDSLVVWWS